MTCFRLTTIFRRWWAADRGAVALIFALTLVPTVAVLGASVDYARMTAARAELQSALDAATLSALNTYKHGRKVAVAVEAGKKTLEGKLAHSPAMQKLSSDFVITDNSEAIRVTSQASLAMNLLIVRVTDTSAGHIQAKSGATLAKTTREVSLVLDVSWSMIFNNAFKNMKTGLKPFVVNLLDQNASVQKTYLSIVTFAEYVNIGKGYGNWLTSSQDKTKFEGCFGRETAGGVTRDPSAVVGKLVLPKQTTGWEKPDPEYGDFPPCPPEASESKFFLQDGKAASEFIDGLILGNGTGTDQAMIWGFRAVWDKWAGYFDNQPSLPLSNKDSRKTMILVTDGEPWSGELYFDKKHPEKLLVDNLTKICKDIKNQGVRIIVVSYESPKELDAVRDCASTPGDYYKANKTTFASVLRSIMLGLEGTRIDR